MSVSILITAAVCVIPAVLLYIKLLKEREKGDTLSKELEDSNRALTIARFDDRNTFMVKLAMGWYTLEKDILDDMERLNISFPSRVFCMFVVSVDSWGPQFRGRDGKIDKDSRKQAEFCIGRVLNECECNIGRINCFISDRHISGLVSVTAAEESLFEKLDSVLLCACELLEAEFDIIVSFGVSRVRKGLMLVSEAFLEAEKVLEYKQLLDIDTCVMTYLDASHRVGGKKGPDIGIDLEKRIINCFELGDYSGVEALIRAVMDDEFENNYPSIEIVKIRYYGIVNLILNLMHEFGEAMDDRTELTKQSMDRLFSASNVTELKAASHEVLNIVVTALNNEKQRPQPLWILKISDAVRERYNDPNLSTSVLADEFGLNQTYASRVFKQNMGKGIYEFIHSVRIEAAIILLREGVPVKDTAEAVGYCDSGALNKAFKKYLGVSPSSYLPTAVTKPTPQHFHQTP